MKLKDVLDIKSISLNVDIKEKKVLFDAMLDLACKSGKIINKEEVRKEMLKREELLSTGIGKGIALPHAKTNATKDTVVAFMTLKEPIEYGSLDGSKVNICLLLIGKENNVGIHLRLLSRISRVLGNTDIVEQILIAKSPQEIIDIFTAEEE
jgi:fructose PTS system EIIBC or EIIC component